MRVQGVEEMLHKSKPQNDHTHKSVSLQASLENDVAFLNSL